MYHARKTKFSSYVQLPSINKLFQYRYAKVILCSDGDLIIFEHGCYISSLEHVRMLIFSSYVLLVCVNPIYKYVSCLDDLVGCILSFDFGFRSSTSEV